MQYPMANVSHKRSWANDVSEALIVSKKGKVNVSPFEDEASRGDDAPPSKSMPISGYDLDQHNYHVHLQDFGASLQRAANAIFPNHQKSRYSKVDVILLSWEDEDPRLPVSIEMNALEEVLMRGYGYDVQRYLIPSKDSHNSLQVRILLFLGDSNPDHLKIVYYAGHGRLTNHGQPAWTRSVHLHQSDHT